MSSKNVIDLRKGAAKAPPQQRELRLTPSRSAPRLQSQRGARVSPIRVRRRRARYIILGVIVFLIALITYGVSWASYLPRYNVGTVTIVGTDQVPSADVYNYVESLLHTSGHPFLSRDNIFLYNQKALQREIVGNFPRIASASISRASLFATAITVTVTERQPYALWCLPAQTGTDNSMSDCYQMDETGFIFAQALASAIPAAPIVATTSTSSSSSGQASSLQAATSTPAASSTQQSQSISQSQQYVFEGGLGLGTSTDATSSNPSGQASTSQAAVQNPIGQTFVGAHMPGIVALLQMLGQAGFSPSGATVENAQDFWVPLKPGLPAGGQGFYIKASFGEDPGSIVSNLALVLSSDALAGKESQLQYVDLRFGDRVYYKLQGAAEAQTK
jgi:hypothetical protein